jgi:sigma-B regulation protein RsbU (phosphoserine phosphatase)
VFALVGRTDEQAAGFDQLVPWWMFVVETTPARLAVAVVIPLAFSIPLLVVSNAQDLRLGPFLVLGVVAVAAVAGWWATLLAGAIVTGLYWWYAVPIEHSFRFDRGGSAIGPAAMVLLVLGISAMARRVQRAVVDVRALDLRHRTHAEAEAALLERSQQGIAQVRAVLELSNALAAARTMADVASAAVDQIALPAWPTTASIAIVGGDRLHVLAARGATAASIAGLEHVDLRSSSWLGQALTGTPILVDDREAFAREFPDARVLRIYPSGSWAVIPFRSESTVGLLSLYYLGGQPVTEHAQFFSLVGEILSTALERARAEEQQQEHLATLEQAFAERDRIARTLSTTLLPPQLPALPGFSAAGWVLPAYAGEVAGDFYDLFSVADGDWVAVLGDVCGKGAEAAAVTSLARYAARVTALSDPDPSHIGDIANAALLDDPSDLFCTMAIVRYRHDRGELEVALAGHPQLRLVAGGAVKRVGQYGAALGFATQPPTVVRVPLDPGAAIVLHSDGLVERHPDFGDPELDLLLADAPAGGADAIAAYVRARVEEVPATRHDDLTLLVIARDP